MIIPISRTQVISKRNYMRALGNEFSSRNPQAEDVHPIKPDLLKEDWKDLKFALPRARSHAGYVKANLCAQNIRFLAGFFQDRPAL